MLKLEELKRTSCGWVMCEDHYCGKDRVKGSLWCEEHRKLATIKSTTTKKMVRGLSKYIRR